MASIPNINCGYCIAPQPSLLFLAAKMVPTSVNTIIANEAYTKYWLGTPVALLIGSAASIKQNATNITSNGVFAFELDSIFSSLVTFGRFENQKNRATAMNKPA